MILVLGGRRVHLEIRANLGTGGVIPLGIDIVQVAAARAVIAVPDDDEVAARIHRHLGLFLVVGRRFIHQKLAAHRRSGRVIETSIDVVVSGPLILPPGHHEGPAGIHGHAGQPFVGCVRRNDKLTTLGRAGTIEPLSVYIARAFPDMDGIPACIHRHTVRGVRVAEGVVGLGAGGGAIDPRFTAAGGETCGRHGDDHRIRMAGRTV